MVSADANGRPDGRPLLTREVISDFKRERCALAVAETVHELGPHALTTKRIVSRAGIARSTFYELFGGCEDASRFACEYASRKILKAIDTEIALVTSDDERLRNAIAALAEFAASAPALAELCVVYSTALMEGCRSPHDQAVVEKLAMVIQAAASSKDLRSPAVPKAEMLAHATLSVLASRIALGEPFIPAVLADELFEIMRATLRIARPADAGA